MPELLAPAAAWCVEPRTTTESATMEAMWNDVQYALRRIRLSPGFSLAVIITLALGVAGTTYVFSEINALYLRPLRLSDPGGLMSVVHDDLRAHRSSFFTSSGYDAIRRESRAFTAWTASAGGSFGLAAGGARPEAVTGKYVDGSYFRVLGIRPRHGRFFGSAESAPGAEPVLVLSHGLWRRRFGSDPGVIGSVVRLNGKPVTVIGVAPEGFNGVSRAVAEEVWVPLGAYALFNPSAVDGMSNPAVVEVVGRLAGGVSRPQAESALAARVAEVASVDPLARQALALRLEPLSGLPTSGRSDGISRKALQLGTAALVLLIASINVAGMLLVRATARRKEIAVRMAIGATRARVIRQLAAESVVLFLLGGTGGVCLAVAAGRIRSTTVSSSVPLRIVLDYGVDGRVLAFALALSLATSLAFGLIPAFQASRTELVPALRSAAEPMRRQSHLRDGFLVGQYAACVLLLLMAGTLLQSLARARHADPGFRLDGVAVSTIDAGLLGYDRTRAEGLYRRLMERLDGVPGGAAALASAVPFGNAQSSLTVSAGVAGGAPEQIAVQATRVSPGYFETLRIPVVLGRGFTPADAGERASAAVVSEAVARRLWPGGDPVGRRFIADGGELEVVGVVRDIQMHRLGARPTPQLYTPIGKGPTGETHILVRAPDGAPAALDWIRRAVEGAAPDLPQMRSMALEELARETLSARRSAASRTLMFGAVGLLLAGIGLYGAIAYQVTLRTHEIGVRMALGANPADVQWLIFRRGMVMALLGTALGVVSYIPFVRVLVHGVYGAQSVGSITLLLAPTAIFIVAALASYLPARRAARLDPAGALRAQ
jgi:predicted permease